MAKNALDRWEGTHQSIAAHHDIVCAGDQPRSINLLLEGFGCRYILLQDGKRQITSFHIPGDIPDLPSLFIPVMDYNVCSLSPSHLFVISRAAMLALFHEQPQLAHLFWHETLFDAGIVREWMVGLGRRSALSRIAHLFCELIVRMRAMGLATDNELELPLTQTDIGDALGLSTVHVNRTLQQLREVKLIKFTRRKLTVMDWRGLRDVGHFEQTYLHHPQIM